MFYSTNKLLFYILSFNNCISNVNFYVQQNYIYICTVTVVIRPVVLNPNQSNDDSQKAQHKNFCFFNDENCLTGLSLDLLVTKSGSQQ